MLTFAPCVALSPANRCRLSIATAKLNEVQKYCSMTNHMWDGFWFLGNKKAFERLPADLDYVQVTPLSFEARQTLQQHRPETLRQASRISGITPATISLLMVHLKKGGFRGFTPTPQVAKGEAA